MAVLHGLEDPEVQAKMEQANAGYFDPRIDRNGLRAPDRMIHIFSVSQRSFTIDRAPLWVKLHLKACPKGERYVACAHIPDPLMQWVHGENGRRRAEANDGMRCAIDLLNPNNPTNDPDWNPSPEMAALFGSSKGCDLFAQGLFISLHETPLEREVTQAESRRDTRYRTLIAHADRLEAINPKELAEFIAGEDGTDLRLALDRYTQQRGYHKPQAATMTCPNCGDAIKEGVAFHKSAALDMICVLDWKKAVAAGVKTKDDVPEDLRWFEAAAPAVAAKVAAKRRR